MMKKERLILTIGRYARPMFWAFLMAWSLQSLWKIAGNFFLPNFFVGLEIGSIIFLPIMLLILFGIIFASVYHVVNPYISKEEFDERNVQWGLAACVLVPLAIVHLLLLHFFQFNLLDFFSSN